MILAKEQYKVAGEILTNAYDMFPNKHQLSAYATKPFPMYSFERVSNMFWQSVIEVMLSRGLNEEQVEWLLRHKCMRYGLDNLDFEDIANKFVSDAMIEEAKQFKGDN